MDDRNQFGTELLFKVTHRRRAANSFEGRFHKPCYACGAFETDKWIRNPPTNLYLCRACNKNLHTHNKTGKKRPRHRYRNKVECYTCGKESLSIFHPNCFGYWQVNYDQWGYPIHYLCRPCYYAILYFKRKYPMGTNYQIGEMNSNWKGGVNTVYNRIRTSPEMLQWKISVFQRDNWICQECGENDHALLNAHHLKQLSFIISEYGINTFEQALACPELWDVHNGMTLCIMCHSEKPQLKVSYKK